MRTPGDRAETELRRERYEQYLRGYNKSTQQRIAESRERREAAQKIGLNKWKRHENQTTME